MLRYALKNLRANATRLVATGTAVIIGIGFLAAGLMLTGAMKHALTGNVELQYAAVDVALEPNGGNIGLGTNVIPAELLREVQDTEGVAAAGGEISQVTRVLDRDGEPVSSRTMGRNWITDDLLNPLTLDDGRAPESDDEVVIDRGTAADAEVRLGDEVTLRTPLGDRRAELVGISSFEGQDSLDDYGTVSFDDATAMEVLNAGVDGYSRVLVRADGDPADVQRLLEEELPASVRVVSGVTFREDQIDQSSGFVDILSPALQGFAYLALFVAGFVIYNTFSVVVTQRYRELALARAVGATPGQVRRSLLLEGIGIGLVASAIGVAAGTVFSLLLQVVLEWFDIRLPGAGVRLSPWTVVFCIAIGTVLTVLSVTVPAFRAGRTKPVEAMRETAVDVSGTSKVRAVIGAVALVAALVLLLLDRFVAAKWFYLGPGAVLLFVGLLIGGPLLARAYALVLQRPMRALGLTSRLATDNVVRNPKRTATTANALVIGLFLVTLVTVSGGALKSWAVAELNKLSSSDYIVAGIISDELAADLEDVPGVVETAPVRLAQTTTTDGEILLLTTADVDRLGATTNLELIDGSLDELDRPGTAAGITIEGLGDATGGGQGGSGPGGIVLADPPTRVGDAVELVGLDGEPVLVTAVASLEGELDALFLGTLVGEETFAAVAGEQPVYEVFIRVEPGQADAVGTRLDDLVEDYTATEVIPGNFIAQAVGQVLDFLIGTVNALLGMSVAIALVGIVNTLTLSIFERRRELGMVRAMGMTKQQVARMIRLESVLMGLLGTLLGVGFGLFLGWVIVGSLGEDIPLAINWARLGLIALAGILVGVLAAVLPARRAVRLDMLEAMQAT